MRVSLRFHFPTAEGPNEFHLNNAPSYDESIVGIHLAQRILRGGIDQIGRSVEVACEASRCGGDALHAPPSDRGYKGTYPIHSFICTTYCGRQKTKCWH